MRTDVGILFIHTSKKVIIANKVVTTDWDIYVPGNVKSVTNMLSVLSACSVEWKWLARR
jgi:hypothetical protein